MQFSTVALAALVGYVSAQTTHVVSVSDEDNSLTFEPDSLEADAGDMIQFQFRGGNHSVAQSTFDAPCTPMTNQANAMNMTSGFFTGFMPVEEGADTGDIPTYTVQVQNDMPMWLYCSQGMHCQAGMVMVVNEE